MRLRQGYAVCKGGEEVEEGEGEEVEEGEWEEAREGDMCHDP